MVYIDFFKLLFLVLIWTHDQVSQPSFSICHLLKALFLFIRLWFRNFDQWCFGEMDTILFALTYSSPKGWLQFSLNLDKSHWWKENWVIDSLSGINGRSIISPFLHLKGKYIQKQPYQLGEACDWVLHLHIQLIVKLVGSNFSLTILSMRERRNNPIWSIGNYIAIGVWIL